MGELQDRMDGDLRLRGLSAVTRAEYLRCAAHFTAYYRVSPQQLGAEDVRSYLLHLVEEQRFSASNMKIHIAAHCCPVKMRTVPVGWPMRREPSSRRPPKTAMKWAFSRRGSG